MTVKVEHLTGGYGKKPVIKDLNFELEKGEIVGLIEILKIIEESYLIYLNHQSSMMN